MLPLALGAAISPLVLLGGVAVMTGPSPLRRGSAFAAGVALPLLAVTAACLALGRALSLPEASDATKGWIDLGLGALLVLLGLRALARPPKPPARPKRQPGERGGGGRLLATGAALMATNVTTFALYIPAIKLIAQSAVDDAEKAVAVALVLVVTMGLVLVPLAIVALAPRASARLLGAMGDWLGAHHRAVTVGLCLGFGAYLLVHGALTF